MKRMKKAALTLASALVLLGAAGCGDGVPEGFTNVKFMYGFDSSVLAEFNTLVDTFNETVGQEKKIFVTKQPKTSGGYQSTVAQQITSSRGPDVVSLEDEWFKTEIDYLEPLDDVVSAEAVSDLYTGIASRLVYNPVTALQDENAKRYAVPAYNNSTVVYVNTGKLKQAGITCISLDEKDVEAFDNGEIADANGKTKQQYGITGKVLKKGFQREKPYVGNSWSKPSASERMIFNDRISMNWDEIEDLGRIMSKNTNPQGSPTTYGFYTEWWFSYGWSVGGDCLIDVSGDYDYRFGLVEDLPNYIVCEGKTYLGAKTGRTYTEGETLEYIDKVAIAEGETIQAENDGRFTINGKDVTVKAEIKEQAGAGTLAELPSTKAAFTRFAKLAAKEYDSQRISPYPADLSSTSISYFVSGELAMILERVSNLEFVRDALDDEWTVTTTPVYKEYVDPRSSDNDEVKVQGKLSTHSHLASVGVRKGSPVKTEAGIFIDWLMTEGQKILATDGFGTVSSAYEAQALLATPIVKNSSALVCGNKNSYRGDWSYLKDRAWIDNWAVALNDDVRNGKQTLDYWFKNHVQSTNAYILSAY